MRVEAVSELFKPIRPAAQPRIGAEVELIPTITGTGAICPLDFRQPFSSLALVRRAAAAQGWIERQSPKGAPLFELPGRGRISFEPGGQLEYASTPADSGSALLAELESVVSILAAGAREAGITLLDCGIDPLNSIDSVPLQLNADRYTRMDAYFAAIGPAGARMMRQTAAMQVSLDIGSPSDMLLRWQVLNAAAPYLTAIFANSSVYEGGPTGCASFRAANWQAVDPDRTGLAWDVDAVPAYTAFALGAPDLLRTTSDGEWLPFIEWIRRDAATASRWAEHLTTLFPEVRPRGCFEVRCIDALAPEWYAAPIVMLSGLIYHKSSLEDAADLLGTPDPALLPLAARDGLASPRIADVAVELYELGLRGARALGAFFLPEDIERAEAFGARRAPCYTNCSAT